MIFKPLMKQVYRKSGAKTDDAYLALFDILPLKEFNSGKSKLTSIERKEKLNGLAQSFDDAIKLVDYEIINFDNDDGQAKFSNMNKEALEKGFEGLMIKPNDNFYECKRSHAWLKIKPFIEVTLKVIDIQEGSGKHEGKLGAFHVEGKDDGKFFSLSVGSGLTDEDRERFWAAKDKLIGRMVEIRADAITQSIEGEHYSLRFQDLKTLEDLKRMKRFKYSYFLLIILIIQSCTTRPPENPDNICLIFKEKKSWYKAVIKSEKRWKIPPYVLMSFVHQESSFQADAKPDREKILGFIPWFRPSSAVGYSQALTKTWEDYKDETGNTRANRKILQIQQTL